MWERLESPRTKIGFLIFGTFHSLFKHSLCICVVRWQSCIISEFAEMCVERSVEVTARVVVLYLVVLM